jgi:hypothetical protein
MREESSIQRACIRWFYLSYPKLVIYAIPNGGKRLGFSGKLMVLEGLLKGMPDLHIPIPSNGYASLYIEMKSAKGKLSPEQQEMIPRLREFGNKVVVCRSIEQFIDEVDKYFRPLK